MKSNHDKCNECFSIRALSAFELLHMTQAKISIAYTIFIAFSTIAAKPANAAATCVEQNTFDRSQSGFKVVGRFSKSTSEKEPVYFIQLKTDDAICVRDVYTVGLVTGPLRRLEIRPSHGQQSIKFKPGTQISLLLTDAHLSLQPGVQIIADVIGVATEAVNLKVRPDEQETFFAAETRRGIVRADFARQR